MSALVIGCMVPDFEYFIRFGPHGGFGHTLLGVFVLDFPLALIALWLYHAYAKEPLYAWLPQSMQRRIQLGPLSPPINNIAQFAMVSLSIFIGVATHILWDSFTHPRFWPYHHWRFLHRTIHLPVYGTMEYVRIVQHASTIFGAVVLLFWVRYWFRTTPPTQPLTASHSGKSPRAALLVVCMLSLAAAAFRAFQVLRFGADLNFGTIKTAIECAIITAIDAFWVGVVVYGILRSRARIALQDA